MKTPEEILEHLTECHGINVGSPVVTDPALLHKVLHHSITPNYWNNHTHEGMMAVPDEDIAYEDQ